MKVSVNKCPCTGKLFEDDKKYANHLQMLRRERAKDKAEQRVKNGFAEWLAEEKNKLVDPDMIAPWILENQQKLMIACNVLKMGMWDSERFYPKTDEFTKFEIKVKWNNNVSNSHSCPKGGVTNWWPRDNSKPTGYLGWQGQVWGTLVRNKKHMSSYPYSNIFELLDLHTGSGGGGNAQWSYELKIFADDWPVMASSETFARLVNGPV
jgi:hypothetical protein